MNKSLDLSVVFGRLAHCGFIAAALFILSINPAYAYLEPGSTSMILQLIVGFLVGGLLSIKFFFVKLKNLFLRPFSSGQNKENDDKA